MLSATLVVSPGGGNDKKRSQLNKSVTQPLAPSLLQLITRFFSVNLHHAARLSFEIRQTIPERFLGRMTNVFHPGNINHVRAECEIRVTCFHEERQREKERVAIIYSACELLDVLLERFARKPLSGI